VGILEECIYDKLAEEKDRFLEGNRQGRRKGGGRRGEKEGPDQIISERVRGAGRVIEAIPKFERRSYGADIKKGSYPGSLVTQGETRGMPVTDDSMHGKEGKKQRGRRCAGNELGEERNSPLSSLSSVRKTAILWLTQRRGIPQESAKEKSTIKEMKGS